MSSFLRQDINQESGQPKARMWFGTFAESVDDFTTLARVILPDFDSKLTWGGARWQARDDVSLPSQGDECLAVFDNRNQLWVVAWWPYV